MLQHNIIILYYNYNFAAHYTSLQCNAKRDRLHSLTHTFLAKLIFSFLILSSLLFPDIVRSTIIIEESPVWEKVLKRRVIQVFEDSSLSICVAHNLSPSITICVSKSENVSQGNGAGIPRNIYQLEV